MDMSRDAAPVWCHPRRRSESPRAPSSLDGGRHPTEARKVVPNPRRAAGSTVVSSWLRLFRCTHAKKQHEDLKKLLPTLDIGSHSNASLQLLPKAAAQRRLEAVSCRVE